MVLPEGSWKPRNGRRDFLKPELVDIILANSGDDSAEAIEMEIIGEPAPGTYGIDVPLRTVDGHMLESGGHFVLTLNPKFEEYHRCLSAFGPLEANWVGKTLAVGVKVVPGSTPGSPTKRYVTATPIVA